MIAPPVRPCPFTTPASPPKPGAAMRLTLLARGVVSPAVLLLLTACGSSGNPSEPGPTPTAIRIQGGNQQTGVVGQALATTISATVVDERGHPVANRRVEWDVSAGSGTVSTPRSNTNSSGVASTTWTLGSTAGSQRLTAQVLGLTPATFTATAIPGPGVAVITTPSTVFVEVGDSVLVRASVRDKFGNVLPNQAITFTALNPTVATASNGGMLTGVAEGITSLSVEAAGLVTLVAVSVGPAGSGPCGSTAAVNMAVGDVLKPAGGSLCLATDSGSAEYALTLISTATSFGSSSRVDVLGLGTRGPFFPAVTAGVEYLSQTGSTQNLSNSADAASLEANRALEEQRRTAVTRALSPFVNDAREWYASTGSGSRGMELARGAQFASVSAGDIIKLNANALDACQQADMRNGRVVAMGKNAMIVSDNDNPAGGYSDAEYTSILATFDTLVYPMDTTAFGAPSNISQYGKIILFYTSAVNALTPRNVGYTIGGFFFGRDLYPKTARNNLSACATSNENEMFYLLVPDPNGTVNGNQRSKESVTLLNINTIAHELQHLINTSRRLYINTGATVAEQTWLDEGLSHIAEELLYFRVAGFTSRQNLNLRAVTLSQTRADQFRNYASQNFARFYRYLTSPETTSPYAPNDSLSTRGAIWNFLRYAAGRQGASGEDAFLHALVNSRTTGVANLQNVLAGSQFVDYLLDWTVALIADDYSAATTAALGERYTIPAWNFRDIFPGLIYGGGGAQLGVYPIATRSLAHNVPQSLTLAGGTSSYLRFSVAADSRALISVRSSGSPLPPFMRYAVVRLR